MEYLKPVVMLIKFDYDLLSMSESEPGATSIGSPSVKDDVKGYSVWDDGSETHYNNTKEEQDWYIFL